MELAANVSTATSRIIESKHLLQEVVDLTKRTFDLYHVHIYLLDPNSKTLTLAAGAGEVGKQMMAEGWEIPMDHQESIVASTARDHRPIIINDVNRDKDSAFLSNRLLPDTRSEMAVPMVVGEKTLGVFDLQANTADYFSDEDARIFTILASQVTVALQNAESYMTAQKQAERETKLNTIAQKIQSTATIEEAMQVTARELGHALGKRQTFVALDPAALAVSEGKDK